MSLATTSIRRRCTAQATIATPLGALLLARTEHGLAGAWFEGQKHHAGELEAAEQLGDYFAGRSSRFDVPLDLHGTGFQLGVWQALRAIGPGQTRSYLEIARTVGSPKAVRAVGAAVGKNPLSVIVPCHRVVGSNGALTGYAGGLHRKRALLALEGVS
jgi:methylated-DNA-[protein]-cysteine S-methyltransferase